MAWNRPTEAKLESGVRHRAVRPKRLIIWLLVAIGLTAVVIWRFVAPKQTSGPNCTAKERTKPLPTRSHERKLTREFPGHPITTAVAKVEKPLVKGKPVVDAAFVRGIRTNLESRVRALHAVHHNGVEQLLLNIFTCEPGDMPRPMPSQLPEKEMARLAEILISKDEIKESDTERMQVAKEILVAGKKEMIQYIKDGGAAEDFFKYYHQQLLAAFYAHHDAFTMVHKMMNDGEEPALISAFIDKTNERFAEQGIKQLAKPPDIINVEENRE